ncbi:sodium/proton antiporter [Citrobacter freundii]|nr:sodium/proton antiporter [Citrobacter freundii]
MSPVTVPVLICGLLTCMLVEKFRWFGYGETLPETVRDVLQQFDDQSRQQRTRQEKIKLIVQAIIGIWLVVALAPASGGSRINRSVRHYSGHVIDRRYGRTRHW